MRVFDEAGFGAKMWSGECSVELLWSKWPAKGEAKSWEGHCGAGLDSQAARLGKASRDDFTGVTRVRVRASRCFYM